MLQVMFQRSKAGGVTLIELLVYRLGVSPTGVASMFGDISCKAGKLSGLHPTYKACRGFTLIELLVVVLIIGILAAVAVPQYQKAVEKARAAEAITVMNSLQKGIELYLLEKGSPVGTSINFMGQNLPMYEGDDGIYIQASLDIGVSSLTCGVRDVENNAYCYSKDFVYYAGCSGNDSEDDYLFDCSIYAS